MVIGKYVGKEKGKKVSSRVMSVAKKAAMAAIPGLGAAKLASLGLKKLNKKTKAGPKGRPGSQIHKATSVKRAKDKKPKTRTVTKRGQTNPKSKRI
tara:strand:- start:130 stop:417 length:288 start_codon:yes stop_codon:yes gene_type:complete